MCHMFRKQLVDGQKNAMPYDIPPHVAKSSSFSDRAKLWLVSKTSQKAQPLSHCNAV